MILTAVGDRAQRRARGSGGGRGARGTQRWPFGGETARRCGSAAAAAFYDALTDGVELRIDLGLIGNRTFVNNASFGAYAQIVQSPAYRDDRPGVPEQRPPMDWARLRHQALTFTRT
jgi:hypothetical protein